MLDERAVEPKNARQTIVLSQSYFLPQFFLHPIRLPQFHSYPVIQFLVRSTKPEGERQRRIGCFF